MTMTCAVRNWPGGQVKSSEAHAIADPIQETDNVLPCEVVHNQCNRECDRNDGAEKCRESELEKPGDKERNRCKHERENCTM